MPGKYSAVWNATNTASATVPIMTLTGAATCRPRLSELVHGSDYATFGTEVSGTFLLRRHSTTPAGGTAITPAPLDPADAAALASAMMGPSIGAPTLGTSLYQWSQNFRATYRWVAQPGYEFVVPATAAAGLSLLPTVASGAAVNWTGTWEWIE